MAAALAGAAVGFALDAIGIGAVSGTSKACIVTLCASLAVLTDFAKLHAVGLLAGAGVFGIYAALASTPLAATLTSSWVRRDSPGGSTDAVVVLSGGLQSNGNVAGEGVDRILTGFEIAQAVHAPIIVTTRAVQRYGSRNVTADADQQRLVALAAPRARWVLLDTVRNTHEEAIRAAEALLPHGIRHILLVTSPMHTRRACGTFEAAGFQVTCVPARERTHVTTAPVTSEDRLSAFSEYLYERLGTIKYKYEKWLR